MSLVTTEWRQAFGHFSRSVAGLDYSQVGSSEKLVSSSRMDNLNRRNAYREFPSQYWQNPNQ